VQNISCEKENPLLFSSFEIQKNQQVQQNKYGINPQQSPCPSICPRIQN
jgi:hypothetical protein